MGFEHELIIPNEGFQFKIFQFEGKNGHYFREKHWHRSIEIFAVYEGHITFYINEEKYELNPGEFILLNSNEIHSIDSPETNDIVVLQIPFIAFEKYYTGDKFIYFTHSPRKQDQEIMELIRGMYLSVTQEEVGFEYKIQSKFFYLLYILVAKYRKTEVSPEIMKHYQKMNRLSVITGYIREHYQEEMSLEKLSARFGYSQAYLSRMFHKYAQTNYKTYLQSIRVEFAFKELINTEHTVSEVAQNNGFPNCKAFSREFRKKYNLFPSEYRKQNKTV